MVKEQGVASFVMYNRTKLFFKAVSFPAPQRLPQPCPC